MDLNSGALIKRFVSEKVSFVDCVVVGDKLLAADAGDGWLWSFSPSLEPLERVGTAQYRAVVYSYGHVYAVDVDCKVERSNVDLLLLRIYQIPRCDPALTAMVNPAARQLWVVGSRGDEGIAAVLDRDLNPVTTIRIREKGDLNAVVFDKVGNLGTSWGSS
jgi:hypothetical protein